MISSKCIDNSNMFMAQFFSLRYKERMEVFLLDVENQSNLNNELSISVATKFLMPFEGRWGFACAYYAKERLLFLHGGFSATHNYGQTVLFQVKNICKRIVYIKVW